MVKKGAYLSVGLVLLVAVGFGFISFDNSKLTGNVISEIDSCSKTVSGVVYSANSNNITSRSNSVLCYQGQLYRCGDLGSTLNPQFISAGLAQEIGSWKCALAQKIWVPSSSCVVNSTTTSYRTYALNNTFGFNSGYPASYTADYSVYCLNGQFYQCGNKRPVSLYRNLSSGAVAGNYQCFNSSGANRWFYQNVSCLSYVSGKYYFAFLNSVRLMQLNQSNPLDYSTGLQTDDRYLCYNNQRYFCGSSPTPSAQSVADGNVIANTWKCSVSQWDVFKPLISSASTSCSCGSYCNFSFGSLTGPSSFIFNVSLVYNLVNGSSVKVSSSVNPTISGVNVLGSFNSILDCNRQGAVVTSARFEVANSNSLAGESAFATHPFDVIYPSCTNECNIIGAKECTANNGYRTCGQYDSDVCLEYGSVSQCVSGTVCSSGQCVVGGRTDTCTPSGKQCSGSLPSNAVDYSSSFNCSLASQVCFQCNQNYTWNGSTCLLSVCPTGQHAFEGACFSDNCGGVLPTGGNYSNGSALYTSGNLNWSFVQLPENLGSCKWSCNAGFKLNSTDNSSCIAGKYNCSDLGGSCSSAGLTAGSVNLSQYASCPNVGDSCMRILICNDSDNGINYSVKGNLTTSISPGILFEDYCLPGYTNQLVERHCLDVSNPNNFTVQYTCPNGCLNGACLGVAPVTCSVGKCEFNKSCLSGGFRISNATGKYYCNSQSGAFTLQKAVNQSCSNNFECNTNFCDSVQGKCVDLVGTVTGAAGWLKRVSCWITSGFNTNSPSYAECISRSS